MAKKDFTDIIGKATNETMAKQNFNNLFGTDEQATEPSRSEPKETPKKKTKKPIKEKAAEETKGAFVPVGYVLKKEGKSQRATILFRPSTLNGLKQRAEEEGKSFNELCNEILENYLTEGRKEN